VGCLITDFGTAGRGKFKFGGQVGETYYSTALSGSDPNYLGDVSNHRLWNGWSWEVQIWWGRPTTARRTPDRIDIIWGSLYRGQCCRQMRVWACGRRTAAGGRTQVPGFLVHLVISVTDTFRALCSDQTAGPVLTMTIITAKRRFCRRILIIELRRTSIF
jgi:hypothetical protein